ncbi:unnamed protein product [Linum trigynum]|uniref:Uncharacterized protein n=1 Tax=Linum trigynum TaxID=586398 RepID=A0AAV2FED9_9ROSI
MSPENFNFEPAADGEERALPSNLSSGDKPGGRGGRKSRPESEESGRSMGLVFRPILLAPIASIFQANTSVGTCTADYSRFKDGGD